MKYLLSLLLTAAVTCNAATVTNLWLNSGGQHYNAPVRFTPLSWPSSPDGVYTVNGEATTTVPVRGGTTNLLEAGYYGVTQGVARAGMVILVPSTTNTYNINSLVTAGPRGPFTFIAAGTNILVVTNAQGVGISTVYTIHSTATGTGSGQTNVTHVAPGSNVTVTTNTSGGVSLYTVSVSGTITGNAEWATNLHGFGRAVQYGTDNLTNWSGLSTSALEDGTNFTLWVGANATNHANAIITGNNTYSGNNTFKSISVTNADVANNGNVTITNGAVSTGTSSIEPNKGTFQSIYLYGGGTINTRGTRINFGMSDESRIDYITGGNVTVRTNLVVYRNITASNLVSTASIEITNTAVANNGQVVITNGFITVQNGYFYPSNALSAWPTAPRTSGEAYVGNSNGVIYMLTSGSGMTWTATNKIAP